LIEKNEHQEILVRLLTENENNLENLAHIAGQNPKHFYRTANFRDADLSSEELSKFDLSASSVADLKLCEQRDEWDSFEDASPAPKQVRMSTEVSIFVHEIFSTCFPGRLSYELENLFWRVLGKDHEGFWDELNHGDIRSEAMSLIGDSHEAHSKLQHRFAYTFSSDLRDRIYELSELANLRSGYVLSCLIYYVFVHEGAYSRFSSSGPFWDDVRKRVLLKYGKFFS